MTTEKIPDNIEALRVRLVGVELERDVQRRYRYALEDKLEATRHALEMCVEVLEYFPAVAPEHAEAYQRRRAAALAEAKKATT